MTLLYLIAIQFALVLQFSENIFRQPFSDDFVSFFVDIKVKYEILGMHVGANSFPTI